MYKIFNIYIIYFIFKYKFRWKLQSNARGALMIL